jgi:hypothetical protein
LAGILLSAMTVSQAANLATGSASLFRQVSISPAACAEPAATRVTMTRKKARNISETLRRMNFGRRRLPAVHCGKLRRIRSSVAKHRA